MRAVWSFWSKPWRARTGFGWSTEKHHLLAWILSVETAQKHYPKTSLFTDDDGAKMLVDDLGLEFENVSVELNALSDHDPSLWMLGKLRAYRAQTEPFIHVDTDVFLWKRLPQSLERAPVFVQNPDTFTIGSSFYKPEKIEEALKKRTKGWLPAEWEWSMSLGSPQSAAGCGILGGTSHDFIRYYVDLAMRVIDHPSNRQGWALLNHKGEFNIVLEQFILAACVAFHRNRPGSAFRDIEIRYLFDSAEQMFDQTITAKLGYTHLVADAKRNVVIADRLEKRVQRDYPEQYERCLASLSKTVTRPNMHPR